MVLAWCRRGVEMVSEWCRDGIGMVSAWCRDGVGMVPGWCRDSVDMVSIGVIMVLACSGHHACCSCDPRKGKSHQTLLSEMSLTGIETTENMLPLILRRLGENPSLTLR